MEDTGREQPPAPAEYSDLPTADPTNLRVQPRQAPPSLMTGHDTPGSSRVNPVHRTVQGNMAGAATRDIDGRKIRSSTLMTPITLPQGRDLTDSPITPHYEVRRPTPSIRNTPPSLRSASPSLDGRVAAVQSPRKDQAELEAMELDLKIREIELERQQIQLERLRLSVRQKEFETVVLNGDVMEDEEVDRAARYRVGDKTKNQTDTVAGEHSGFAFPTATAPNAIPSLTARAFPLHSTGRFATTEPRGSGTSRWPQMVSRTLPSLNQSQLYARQSKLRDLPPFSGQPEEWTMFIANYERTTQMYGYTDEENVERLSKALSGKAREMVGHRLTHAQHLPQVLNVLRRHFGRPEIIVHHLIRKIRQLPSPRLERAETIVDFGNAVQEMAAVISSSGLYEYTFNVALLQEMVEKLPPVLLRDWSHYRLLLSVPTIDDFKDWIEKEVEAASYNTLPSVHEPKTEGKRLEGRKNKPTTYLNAMVSEIPETSIESSPSSHRNDGACVTCKGSCRRLDQCPVFLTMNTDQRWAVVRGNVCRQCLRRHGGRCRLQKSCGVNGCRLTHHELLHDAGQKRGSNNMPGTQLPEEPTRINIAVNSPITESVNSHMSTSGGVLLQYVPILVFGNGKIVETYAFFDSGSTGTFIEESLVDELGLSGTPHPLCIRWTGDLEKDENRSMRFVIQIANPDNRNKVFTLPKVHSLGTLSLPSQSFSAVDVSKRHKHLKGLPLRSYKNVKPRVLIGIDNCYLMRPLQYAEGQRQEPAAFKTPLGWIVFGESGNLPRDDHVHSKFHICMCGTDDLQKIDTVMREYFTIESLGVTKTSVKLLSKEDEKAIEILTAATTLLEKRYETCLLWRFDGVRLPSSKDMALKRYECLRRRMRKDPALASAVLEKMNSYIDQGYVRQVSAEEVKAQGARDWFLPVFPVFNPNKPGKIRLVFDAAAKSRGVSLNSFLLTGPDLLASLLAVLYKFREHRIAIVGDIKEMFFQVRMKAEDQRSQFFFWSDNDFAGQEPAIYAVAVMTFGAACSPSSAQFVKNLNASRFEHQHPRATRCIKEEHYVDDMLASVETEEDAIKLAEEVRYIHAEGGFEIRNWLSNSTKVMKRLQQVERTGPVVCTGHTTEKVLGMWWDVTTDQFTFQLSSKHDVQLLTGQRIPSKKEVLSTLMTVYDPMGLIGNFLMYIKILMQEIWRAGIGWDQQLDGRLAEKWLSWIKVLPSILSNVKVPRCYRQSVSHDAAEIQLHVFCDASENGMAAVAYLRFVEGGLVECALVGSKTRVAPLRFLSIPRLELQAAVIGTRFADSIIKSHRLKISQTTLWTDSRDVVCWLKADHRRYSQFVAFRVSEILETTDVKQWRWLSTKLNVADEGTKWQRTPSMDPSSRWFHGPEFLWHPENEWPGSELPSEETSEEIRLNLFHHTQKKQWIDVSRFSSWSRLVRAIAYVLRFVTFVSSRRTSLQKGTLTQPELARAEMELFILAQRDTFQVEIRRLETTEATAHPWKPRIPKSSPLYKLCPLLDENSVLRARGRLANCPWVSEATKNPIILPRNHQVTSLLLQHYHRRYKHSHHQAAVNEVRSQFCIPRLVVEYTKMRRSCQYCKNRDVRPKPPLMGNLPPQRLGAFQRPFSFTGVDYFGPISVAVGRRMEKRWGVLFTCLTTRAIHLEVAHTLTTSSCVMAIRRFISRRGTPLEFVSDRGTNFVGTARELKEAWENVNENELTTQFTGPNLRWQFNPPGAPHFGGCWERLVQSVKKVLSGIRMPRLPTDEVLLSALTEVETIVNSRPLTQIPLDDESEPALTPNHFLLGTSNAEHPIKTFDDTTAFLKMNWKASQALAELFWKKWVAEYLPTLTRRDKWFDRVQPVAVNDIVVIVDANLPRSTWPKGRVVDVVTAKDGQVRQATVQTAQGLITRPATKVAVLDVRCTKSICEENVSKIIEKKHDVSRGIVDSTGINKAPDSS